MKMKGFTLVETVVVVGITASLMIVITTVLLNSLKLNNKTGMNEKVTQNGNWAVEEIRRNLLNAYGVGMSCPDYEITFRNRQNEIKTINCSGNKISLIDVDSGQSVDLTQPEVEVVGCNQFVSCQRLAGDGSPIVNSVEVNFRVSIGSTTAIGQDNLVEKQFSTKVTMRN